MNTGERLRDDSADAQIQRDKRGVFAARPLPVVHARNEDAAAFLLRARRERRVHGGQAEVRQVRHVRAERQKLRVRRRNVVGGDVVLHLQQHLAGNGIRQRLAQREGLNVRAADDLHRVLFARRDRRDNQIVVDGVRLRHRDVEVNVKAARIRQHASQRRDSRRLAGDQVNTGGLCAAAAVEIAVVRANGDGVRARRLSHADARPASGFQNARARRNHVRQSAVARQHRQHLLRSGADDKAHVRVHSLALQNPGDAHHVGIGRVRAGTDKHLIDLNRAALLDGFHDVRHMGLRDERLKRGQINVEDFVIRRIRICGQRHEVLLALLRFEERMGHFIRREDGGRCAEFRAHVRNRRALRDTQRFHAVADVLHHLADTALDGQPAQDFQNNVLRRNAVGQLAMQAHADDTRARQIIRAAAHRDRNVQSARADGKHPNAATRGRMAVRAEQRVARHAEALQLYLMADTVAGLRAVNAMLFRHRLDVIVVIRIFKASLQRVMVNVRHGLLCLDALDAHRLELQVRHRAGGILRQRLVNADGDFRTGNQFTAEQVRGQDFLGQIHRHEERTPFIIRKSSCTMPKRAETAE